MSKKLYEETQVRAVAAAIRNKLIGGTDKYRLSDMPAAIEAIGTDEKIVHADIPDYIKAAALELAAKVRTVQTEGSITFLAASDAHMQSGSTQAASTCLHAGMAMKVLAYALPDIDFCCFLGDYTDGGETTTLDEGRQQLSAVNADIGEGFAGMPQFRTVGECDGLRSAATQNGAQLTSSELFSYIGRYCSGAVYGSTTEGYCYRDFSDKKLRVICMNTSEGGADGASVSSAQLLWLARTLRTVGSKNGWGVLILSHYPLDFSEGCCGAAEVLQCYINAQPYVSGSTGIPFANCNKAKLYAAVHGHTHNFITAKLSRIEDGTAAELDVKRIAIPNMCFSRNNEPGQNDGAEYAGIEFGQTDTYDKTADTAEDTSFTVNVIDPTAQKMHSFCYGAGCDRETAL